jgi:HEAT repeat protein
MPLALSQLFSGDDDRAQAALTQLTGDDIPALMEALARGSADERWWAVRALAALASAHESALSALLTAAADPDADVRSAVFHALGEIRAPEAVIPLLFALNDSSPYLARLAADALIRIGAPAVPGLLRALEQDAVASVRTHAARALALIGDPAAIPALFCALDDDSALVRHWADDGLERLGAGQVYFMP